MSKIYDEFVKNFNKLAEINEKPFMENKEDFFESWEESEEELLDDDSEPYMPSEEKPMERIGLKSAIQHINEAIGDIGTSYAARSVTIELNDVLEQLKNLLGEK